MLKKQKIGLFLIIGLASFILFTAKTEAAPAGWTAITSCDDRLTDCSPGQAWDPAYWYVNGSGMLWCVNHPAGFPPSDPPDPPCDPGCGNTSQRCSTETWGDGCGGNCNGTKDCSIGLTLSANPNLVEYDNPSTLTWIPQNATGCWGEPWPVIGGKSSANGTYAESTGNLTSSKTYAMRCWNPYNSVTKSVSVCVNPKCNNPGNSCEPPANLCIFGEPIGFTEPQPNPPTSPTAPAHPAYFKWKCRTSCGGNTIDSPECSSEKSNPDVPVSSESGWSDCNLSCGGGNQTRTINYHNCYKKTETRACNSQPCPPSYKEVAPW